MILNKPFEEFAKTSSYTRVLLYFITNTDPNTLLFKKTYKQMKDELKVSEVTIRHVFETLEEIGNAEYLGKSTWRNKMIEKTNVNPNADPRQFYFKVAAKKDVLQNAVSGIE